MFPIALPHTHIWKHFITWPYLQSAASCGSLYIAGGMTIYTEGIEKATGLALSSATCAVRYVLMCVGHAGPHISTGVRKSFGRGCELLMGCS